MRKWLSRKPFWFKFMVVSTFGIGLQYVLGIGVVKAGIVWWQNLPEVPMYTVSWPPVEAVYASQEVYYLIVDTPADNNTKWMASAAWRDTLYTFEALPSFDQGYGLRQLCVRTQYVEKPEPCPTCGEPVSLQVRVCAGGDGTVTNGEVVDCPDKGPPNEISEAVCLTYEFLPS